MSSRTARVTPPPAFEQVYDQYHGRIRRYLDRRLGATESEDVTQEVFARVSQALPGFRGDCSVATWIYRIARNAAYDRLRREASRPELNGPAIDADAMPDRSCSNVEQQTARREMSACVGSYIAKLPADYRTVLDLSEGAGLTNQEIADTLHVTLDTAKIRLHRARARLRNELGCGCDFYRDDRNELACEPKRRGVSRRD